MSRELHWLRIAIEGRRVSRVLNTDDDVEIFGDLQSMMDGRLYIDFLLLTLVPFPYFVKPLFVDNVTDALSGDNPLHSDVSVESLRSPSNESSKLTESTRNMVVDRVVTFWTLRKILALVGETTLELRRIWKRGQSKKRGKWYLYRSSERNRSIPFLVQTIPTGIRAMNRWTTNVVKKNEIQL